MITTDYCRLMARYNAWQNGSLLAAGDSLSDAERWRDRGAFFGSIRATLNHLYWEDALWLDRFAGNERPEDSVPVDLNAPHDWETFKTLRAARDEAVTTWANALEPADLSGDVAWYPAGGSTRITKEKSLCIVHLFNHQTHHRGQVHAMLTAAGVEPEPTDLPILG